MEEYFYILAGVAYLAYSFYSASQKKKAKESQREDQPYEAAPDEDSDFDIEKLFGIDNLRQKVETLPYELMGEDQAQIIEETKSPIIDEIKPVKKKYAENVQRQTEDLLEEESLEEHERIDLRQAIIYSEILNPPYIQK
jgi:hypothetical protein